MITKSSSVNVRDQILVTNLQNLLSFPTQKFFIVARYLNHPVHIIHIMEIDKSSHVKV